MGVISSKDGSCQDYLKLFTEETRKFEGLITDYITVNAYKCRCTHTFEVYCHTLELTYSLRGYTWVGKLHLPNTRNLP